MDDYAKIVQRHVMPLWQRDKNGGCKFSSTATFLKNNDIPYCVFASHSLLRENVDFENIGTWGDGGEFFSISDISSKSHNFKENDIVACRMIDFAPRKIYFDLNKKYDSKMLEHKIVNWLGFPAEKARKPYHHTKVKAGRVADDHRPADNGQLIWRNANFLWLEAEFLREIGDYLEASHSQKNLTYQVEGTKSQGYSLKGMSGGALFYVPPSTCDQKTIDGQLIIEFAGIGTEYENNIIKGVSKNKIMDLICNLEKI